MDEDAPHPFEQGFNELLDMLKTLPSKTLQDLACRLAANRALMQRIDQCRLDIAFRTTCSTAGATPEVDREFLR
jgi:hypothetical protein